MRANEKKAVPTIEEVSQTYLKLSPAEKSIVTAECNEFGLTPFGQSLEEVKNNDRQIRSRSQSPAPQSHSNERDERPESQTRLGGTPNARKNTPRQLQAGNKESFIQKMSRIKRGRELHGAIEEVVSVLLNPSKPFTP